VRSRGRICSGKKLRGQLLGSRKAFRLGSCSHTPRRQRVRTRARTTNLGPFGEVIRATGPMAKTNPFRFSTKYQDDQTDLLYYGYRCRAANCVSSTPYMPAFQVTWKRTFPYLDVASYAVEKGDSISTMPDRFQGKTWEVGYSKSGQKLIVNSPILSGDYEHNTCIHNGCQCAKVSK
jgi:hypothetical protein